MFRFYIFTLHHFAYITVHVVYQIYLDRAVAANADIFFDDTLQRVSGSGLRRPQLHRNRKILMLLKWIFNQQGSTMSMNVRTDSQGIHLLLLFLIART